jgi:hypothetical protein
MEEPMNEQSNTPMSVEPSGSAGVAGWVSTWMTAITKPNEQTFATMADHPDARSNNRAFIWVFLGGTVSALISGILTAIIGMAGFAAASPLDVFGGGAGQGGIASLGIAICTSPISGAIGVLAFAISTGIFQWVAKMFKGTGTYSQLAYVLAAISVPFNLVFGFLVPFNGIRFVGACASLITLVALVYVVFLEIAAVKGVNKFGWGQAAGSVLLPALVVGCCVAVVVFGALSFLGPAIGETFESINQSLP